MRRLSLATCLAGLIDVYVCVSYHVNGEIETGEREI